MPFTIAHVSDGHRKTNFRFFRILHDSGWKGRLKRKVIWTEFTTNHIQIQNLDDYLKDRFNLDLLCPSRGRLERRECSNDIVFKVNLCLSCCASNKLQSFRYPKILWVFVIILYFSEQMCLPDINIIPDHWNDLKM